MAKKQTPGVYQAVSHESDPLMGIMNIWREVVVANVDVWQASGVCWRRCEPPV